MSGASTDDGGLLAVLRADLAANEGSAKGRVVVSAYRIAHRSLGDGSAPPRWGRPVRALYRLVVDWFMGIDIPAAVQAGPGLCVWHGTGLVVHASVRMGSNVTLRHGTTLGALGEEEDAVGPTIGDRVSIGAGAIVLGPHHIGDDAVIGAGAVVISDVPAGATAVGNPARIIADRSGTGS